MTGIKVIEKSYLFNIFTGLQCEISHLQVQKSMFFLGPYKVT